MGYSIYIGNAELESEWGDVEQYAWWRVAGTEHPEAPFTDDATKNTNGRHPGYGQWSEFTKSVELHERFFGQEGLMSEHPGCKPLTPEDLAIFEAAQKRYIAAHPGNKPGACNCLSCCPWLKTPAMQEGLGETPVPVHDPSLDFNINRLEWLIWWTRWALANCERPAISNS